MPDQRREHAHRRAARLLQLVAFAEQAVVARRLRDRATSKTATWPSKRSAAPDTSGLPRATHARVHRVPRGEVVAAVERRRRPRATSGASSSAPTRAAMRLDAHLRIDRQRAARAAASTLRAPMSRRRVQDLPLQIGEIDVIGDRRSVTVPTPAAARNCAAGAPSPPTPMISACAAANCSCASGPSSTAGCAGCSGAAGRRPSRDIIGRQTKTPRRGRAFRDR